jgi:hypothetical protein
VQATPCKHPRFHHLKPPARHQQRESPLQVQLPPPPLQVQLPPPPLPVALPVALARQVSPAPWALAVRAKTMTMTTLSKSVSWGLHC